MAYPIIFAALHLDFSVQLNIFVQKDSDRLQMRTICDTILARPEETALLKVSTHEPSVSVLDMPVIYG